MTDYPRPLLDTPLWTDGPTPLESQREYNRELGVMLDEMQRDAATRGTCPSTGLLTTDPTQASRAYRATRED